MSKKSRKNPSNQREMPNKSDPTRSNAAARGSEIAQCVHRKTIVLFAAIGSLVLAAGFLLIVCASSGKKELSIPSGTSVCVNDKLYFEVARYNQPQRSYQDKVRNTFCSIERTGPLSWLAGLFGGGSASEMLAESIEPGLDYLGRIAAARSIEESFPDMGVISDIYCSSIKFHKGIYGIENAASYYFGKRAENLTDRELNTLKTISASEELCSLTPVELSDRISGVSFSSDYENCLLFSSSYLTGLTNQLKSLLIEQGMTEADAFSEIYCGDIRVDSTLDPELQNAVNKTIAKTKMPESVNTAVQIMDYNGNILASSGGSSGGSTVDRTQIPLSPGSSIKPLSVYSIGIDTKTINFSSMLRDVPYDFASSWPQNFDKLYDEEVTTLFALCRSKNTTAVWLSDELTPPVSYEFLKKAGCKHLDTRDVSVSAMGMGYLQSGITVSEMDAAYQMFGNGGYYVEPTYIKRVFCGDELIFEYEPQCVQMISQETAAILNRMMKSNIDLPIGLGRGAKTEGVEVFGKTGTTDNEYGVVNNNWFIGGTPDYIAAVWVGMENQQDSEKSEMPSCIGIWNSIKAEVPHRQSEFFLPDTVVSAEFCLDSGMLKSDGCEHCETGYYTRDNIPEKCKIIHN